MAGTAVVLRRTGQIGLKIETTEGTEEVLVDADFAGNRKESSHKYGPESYERALERGGTLSKLGVLKGHRLMTYTWQEEMAGGGANVEAPWHRTLQGMGFGMVQLKACTTGAVTNGPFVTGNLIGNAATQGAATKTGIVIGVFNGKLVYRPLTGTFAASDVIYGYNQSPQPSTTLSGAPANAGYHFRPLSESAAAFPPSLTIQRRIGGERHTAVACRGRGSITLRRNEPPLINAEFMGCPVVDSNGRPLSGAAVNAPTVGVPPLTAKGLPTVFGAYTPVFTELEVSIDNTMAPRDTITNADFASSGYVGVRIGDRVINASINPEYAVDNTFDLVARSLSGSEFRFEVQHGAVGHGNGLLLIGGRRVQIADEFSDSDRNGIVTSDVPLQFLGDSDDEIDIAHVFA